MKFTFGKRSQFHLDQLSYSLAYVLREALAYGIMDFSIIESFRDAATQDAYYADGRSKVYYPNSKHNLIPAKAGDVVPYIDGSLSWNKLHCCVLAGIILAASAKLGIGVRWGGDWGMDGEPITDQQFNDLVHYEEVG